MRAVFFAESFLREGATVMTLSNTRDVIQITYQVLAATALIFAATIGYHQLQANESVRRAQAVSALLDIWDDPAQRQARQFVNSVDFTKLTSLSDMPPEQRKQVDAVLTTSNHIAYEALTGVAPARDVAELMGPGLVNIWERVTPLVQSSRARGDARYMSYLEGFVTQYRSTIPASRSQSR